MFWWKNTKRFSTPSSLNIFMNFNQYKGDFEEAAFQAGYTEPEIRSLLEYARKLNNHNLPIIFDQKHFSELVGYTYDYILGVTNFTSLYYKHYQIPKKNDTYRQLDEPYPDLKSIQEWILHAILEPASRVFVSSVAKAFLPGKNLRDNARFHRNKKKVVSLDIHDFFGSIRYGLVYGVFTRLGYAKSVSTLLTKLCMYRGSLPQGAPTSPMLSNLIFKDIDDRLFSYCKQRRINYTRYADDMTFSGNSIDTDHLIPYVKNAVQILGLQLNEEKTNVMGRGMCQKVTGIVVNERLQAQRHYRKKIRQEVYYIIKYGLASHLQHLKDYPAWIQTEKHYMHYLLGKVNYVLQVNPHDREFQQYAAWLCCLL